MHRDVSLARINRVPISNFPAAKIAGKYKEVDKVGEGKYGTVYKAYNQVTQTYVALKKINQEQEKHGVRFLFVIHQFPKTALREIALLKQLQHPNIVKFIEVATLKENNKEVTYLVLEYMEHDFLSLMKVLKFSLSEIKSIMKQILSGLDYMHSNNIYHRDLKRRKKYPYFLLANNILYNNRGEVKICDFGMANQIRVLKTSRIQIPQYRAPEIYFGIRVKQKKLKSGQKEYTSKVDIWSAGIFFLELGLSLDHGLFNLAKNEKQCFNYIIEKCGTPTEDNWPGVSILPFYYELIPSKSVIHARSLRQFIYTSSKHHIDDLFVDLIDKMLQVNPENRISAKEALNHRFFFSDPEATPPSQQDFKVIKSALKNMPKPELECNSINVLQAKKGGCKTNQAIPKSGPQKYSNQMQGGQPNQHPKHKDTKYKKNLQHFENHIQKQNLALNQSQNKNNIKHNSQQFQQPQINIVCYQFVNLSGEINSSIPISQRIYINTPTQQPSNYRSQQQQQSQQYQPQQQQQQE